MPLKTDAVTRAVPQKLFESRCANLVQTLLVNFLGDCSVLQVLYACVVRRQHGFIQALGVVVGLADAERPLALCVVATYLSAEAQDQSISRLKPVFAGNGVGKSGAFAERN